MPNVGMDDPTTDLSRDPLKIVLVVAGSSSSAADVLRSYGVAGQIGQGVKIIKNVADAISAVASYPASTPWCVITDGLTDPNLRKTLNAWFGPVKTVANALDVRNVGVAMRFPVQREGNRS